jgi:NAD(P)-dependent dehydrogenase (short-subunit alcohol dehydrogenase family)
MKEFRLEGKVAIITGASRGIGKAIAQSFARYGAKVAVSSRSSEGVRPVAEEIIAQGGEAIAIQAHMGEPSQVEDLVSEAIDRWGRIDIAVNNAATNPHFGPMVTAQESQVEKILDVNLKGYFRLCQQVVPHMRQMGGGKIINMASVAGIQPGQYVGVYSVSKAGVLMLTQVLARELGPDNICVNAIAPGLVKTRFSRVLWDNEDILSTQEESTPLGRIGEPEDVVGAALFLASSASDWVTGIVLTVDGGASLATLI